MTQFQTGELTIGEYTFKAQYIPFDVRRELDGAHHCIHADSYRGNYFFSFYNEDDEEQSAKNLRVCHPGRPDDPGGRVQH